MPVKADKEFSDIPARHRYIAARAVEHVQDWCATGVHCVSVEVGRGRWGKLSGMRRVWVNSMEADRRRRGLRVPDYTTPSAYRTLIHRYLAHVLERRVGCATPMLKPL